MVIKIAQVVTTVFLGCVAGLYLFQALHTPNPAFTRRECWTIGVVMVLAAMGFGLATQFNWFEKLDQLTKR